MGKSEKFRNYKWDTVGRMIRSAPPSRTLVHKRRTDSYPVSILCRRTSTLGPCSIQCSVPRGLVARTVSRCPSFHTPPRNPFEATCLCKLRHISLCMKCESEPKPTHSIPTYESLQGTGMKEDTAGTVRQRHTRNYQMRDHWRWSRLPS